MPSLAQLAQLETQMPNHRGVLKTPQLGMGKETGGQENNTRTTGYRAIASAAQDCTSHTVRPAAVGSSQ
jgi:hypothetical protein